MQFLHAGSVELIFVIASIVKIGAFNKDERLSELRMKIDARATLWIRHVDAVASYSSVRDRGLTSVRVAHHLILLARCSAASRPHLLPRESERI